MAHLKGLLEDSFVREFPLLSGEASGMCLVQKAKKGDDYHSPVPFQRSLTTNSSPTEVAERLIA